MDHPKEKNSKSVQGVGHIELSDEDIQTMFRSLDTNGVS